VGLERSGDRRGKSVAVHGQGAAGRHLMGVGRAHDQRAKPAHLLVQEPDGGLFVVVGAEGIGADQLCQPLGLVRIGRAQRTHLMQGNRQAALANLPGRLRARQPAADDMDRRSWFACQFACHGA
jgi:hypothetical protein